MVEISADELPEKLCEILETWPLYRGFAYSGAPNNVRLPDRIQLLCASCGTKQFWSTQSIPGENNRNGLGSKQYRCACNRQTI